MFITGIITLFRYFEKYNKSKRIIIKNLSSSSRTYVRIFSTEIKKDLYHDYCHNISLAFSFDTDAYFLFHHFCHCQFVDIQQGIACSIKPRRIFFRHRELHCFCTKILVQVIFCLFAFSYRNLQRIRNISFYATADLICFQYFFQNISKKVSVRIG